jgi:non-ribosomal peptide synthase protein (TIGR01720 family)
VQDPPWLTNGSAKGQNDGVRYNPDGNSLTFVGRKDNQVKINGQRLELGEVEHHVKNALSISDPREEVTVVADMIKPRDHDRALLAAFIHIGTSRSISEVEHAAAVGKASKDLRARLASRVPLYMIPSACLPLPRVPRMTVSAKVDRRRIRELGNSLTFERMRNAELNEERPTLEPSNDTERTLQHLWSTTLNLPSEIGVEDDFFRLGGDSISAMQISGAARAAGISVTVANILQLQKIRLIAPTCKPFQTASRHMLVELNSTKEPFDLSPIQQFYFERHLEGNICSDQCLLFSLKRPVRHETLEHAIHTVVSRHAMLRARFHMSDSGSWKQTVSESVDSSYRLQNVAVESEEVLASTIAQCRGALDIVNGPQVSGVYVRKADKHLFFLAIHHLCIDFVSWRILLAEIETLVESRSLGPAPPVTFHQWSTLQHEYAAQHLDPKATLPFKPMTPDFGYWGLQECDVGRGTYLERRIVLDESTSLAILGRCNDRLQTRPQQLMIAVLLHAFATTFTDRPLPAVYTEGHGREGWDDAPDVSQTVGWFTTCYPVQVDNVNVDDLVTTIERIRDCMQSLPKNGWSYFTSKYLHPNGRKAFPTTGVEVNLNYLGAFQQVERDVSLFEPVQHLPPGSAPASTEQVKRDGVIDVRLQVTQSCLSIDALYPERVKHREDIEDCIERFVTLLKNLPTVLT